MEFQIVLMGLYGSERPMMVPLTTNKSFLGLKTNKKIQNGFYTTIFQNIDYESQYQCNDDMVFVLSYRINNNRVFFLDFYNIEGVTSIAFNRQDLLKNLYLNSMIGFHYVLVDFIFNPEAYTDIIDDSHFKALTLSYDRKPDFKVDFVLERVVKMFEK